MLRRLSDDFARERTVPSEVVNHDPQLRGDPKRACRCCAKPFNPTVKRRWLCLPCFEGRHLPFESINEYEI